MNWLSRLFGRRKREKELDEEVRSHLEMAAQERMERGDTAKEAEHAARREFGNVGLVQELTHDAWGWGFLDRLGQDGRFGLRVLPKSPGFTTAGLLSLGPGI